MDARGVTEEQVELALRMANTQYGGNLMLDNGIRRVSGTTVRFRVRTRDSHAYGSRRSPSGRHVPAASWEAMRDFLTALFEMAPEAVVKTAITTYRGRDGFERDYSETAYHEVGSLMAPATIRELSVPAGGCSHVRA